MAELINELSWSKSRDELFRDCKRAYFYRYYGSWGGWKRTAPKRTRELYILKNLTNVPIYAGSVVHDMAERVLKTLFRTGKLMSLDTVISDVRDRILAEEKISKSGAYVDGVKVTYGDKQIKSPGFAEHHFGGQIDSDALITQVTDAVVMFFDSAILTQLEKVAPKDVLSIESLESFEVNGVKVWVKMDVAVKMEGRVVIIDWKTGKPGASDDTRFQLGTYRLYAERNTNVDPADIIAMDVNLRTGEETIHPPEADPDAVEAFITDSAKEMQLVLDDVERNTATENRFPLTSELWRCKRCAFRQVCGRE